MKKILIKVFDCILGILLWLSTAMFFLVFLLFLTDSPDTNYVGRTKYDALVSSFCLVMFSAFYCLSLVWSRAIFNGNIGWQNFKHFYIFAFIFIAFMSLGLLYELYDYDILFDIWGVAFVSSPYLTIALLLISLFPSKQSVLRVKRKFFP